MPLCRLAAYERSVVEVYPNSDLLRSATFAAKKQSSSTNSMMEDDGVLYGRSSKSSAQQSIMEVDDIKAAKAEAAAKEVEKTRKAERQVNAQMLLVNTAVRPPDDLALYIIIYMILVKTRSG